MCAAVQMSRPRTRREIVSARPAGSGTTSRIGARLLFVRVTAPRHFLRRLHEAGAAVDVCVSVPVRHTLSAQIDAAPPVTNHDSSERMFLPRDTFWGYGQFDLAPPHNEIDPNLCRADAGIVGGVNSPCTAFARYMISGICGSASLWARGVPAVFSFWRAQVSVRQEPSADPLHLVDGSRLGWRIRGVADFTWAKDLKCG